MKTLGIYQFIRNATKFDYPFEESILSAIPIADQIVICECYSEDDTYERALDLQNRFPGKIKIVQHPWIEHYSELSQIGNYCIPYLTTDWHMQLQADEVFHEKDYNSIRNIVEDSLGTFTAVFVNYFHFLGNYETEFDFIYKQTLRLARKGSGWWLTGDACELGYGDVRKTADSSITLYHYGKVKDAKKGYAKEVDFQSYYTDLGFPDPKMKEMKDKIGEYCDYVYLFEEAIKKGEVRRFTGTHPQVMQKRIQEFKDGGFEQFLSKMKEGLKAINE